MVSVEKADTAGRMTDDDTSMTTDAENNNDGFRLLGLVSMV